MEELLQQSSSTVRSVIKHSLNKWNAVLGWNNSAADLLIHFSRHLGNDIASDDWQPSSGSTRVKILSDEAQARVFGVRINDREVRFVDKAQGISHFQNSVLSAVESWSKARLKELDHLRDHDPYGLNSNTAPSA